MFHGIQPMRGQDFGWQSSSLRDATVCPRKARLHEHRHFIGDYIGCFVIVNQSLSEQGIPDDQEPWVTPSTLLQPHSLWPGKGSNKSNILKHQNMVQIIKGCHKLLRSTIICYKLSITVTMIVNTKRVAPFTYHLICVSVNLSLPAKSYTCYPSSSSQLISVA